MLQRKNMARSVPDDQTKSSFPIEPCFVLLAFMLLHALVAALLQKHTTRGGPNPRSPIVVVEVVGTPGPATAFPNLILIQNEPPMVALWVPNAASESPEKKQVCFYLSRSSWPRTPGPATAFPNLSLVQNQPPMVALWVPNAVSESLQQALSICLGHLGPEHLVPPQLFPI